MINLRGGNIKIHRILEFYVEMLKFYIKLPFLKLFSSICFATLLSSSVPFYYSIYYIVHNFYLLLYVFLGNIIYSNDTSLPPRSNSPRTQDFYFSCLKNIFIVMSYSSISLMSPKP